MNTYTEKDLLLAFICENCGYSRLSEIPYERFPIKDKEIVCGIFKLFVRKELISDCKCGRSSITFLLRFEATDFLSHGGFQAQEELLQKNIERLLLEIESLKPAMPTKVETITNIASGIATALGLLIKQ